MSSTDAFAERLRTAVELSGLSRGELAEQLHVSRQAIRNWLSAGTIHRSRIAPFCDACRVDIRWLLTGEGDAALKVLPNKALEVEQLANDIATRFSISDQVAVAAQVLLKTHRRLV